jgi:hypothetical protein
MSTYDAKEYRDLSFFSLLTFSARVFQSSSILYSIPAWIEHIIDYQICPRGFTRRHKKVLDSEKFLAIDFYLRESEKLGFFSII